MNNFSPKNESLEFLRNQFKSYYETSEIELPDRFGRREFAFVFFGGKGMFRHVAFDKKKAVKTFLQERAPQHVYYSSAYYKTPDATKMQDKGWMGAELIFDLDSDHLPNAEKMGYVKSLNKVKEEFFKLVEDFLLCDFGFDEKNLDLYFSGGRGYHCHVRDPKIFNLGSNERREIVDYITGRDIKDSLIFHDEVTSIKRYGARSFPGGKTLKMPTPNEPGWKGRISRGIVDIVDEIKQSEDPIQKLKEYGVKEKDAEKLLNDLSEKRVQRIKEGRLDQSKTIRKFFLNSALRKTAVVMSAGETDEPVTCDVKRLIRLPSSLHGKTGLKVVKITLDGLKNFDPLIDAVVFSDETIKIKLNQQVDMKMNSKQFHLKEGEQEVPKYLAVFLIGRRTANVL